MERAKKKLLLFQLLLTIAFLSMTAPITRADAVSEWNIRACELVGPPGIDTPNSNRILAAMHTAIYEAANAITKRYPPGQYKIDSQPGASVDAAIAAASHIALSKLAPAKQAEIDAAYQAALAKIPDGPPKTNGITVGEKAAEAVLASRLADGFESVEKYRPYTVAGVYVPTAVPLVSQWPSRKPWLMTSASQFRPGPPPKLTSETWARDYNEIKALGRKANSTRTAEQTDIARFWETTGASIYHGIVRAITDQPGRDVTQNARLFMAVTQAADDAIIAVFDAKYHYNFWRPVTAIRNGDIDGNDATERDASWTPFINTPMHPEYPCAHCISAAAIGTVLEAEIGNGPVPVLATSSPTANNARRTWMKVEDFIQEVSNGRIYDGVHFRTSTEVGIAMGRQVGKLAVEKYFQPIK
jgi:hypothetical protein